MAPLLVEGDEYSHSRGGGEGGGVGCWDSARTG